jgi:hypothetical protein
MPVLRTAFRLAGGERHLGGLRALISQHDAETLPELKVLVLLGMPIL